MKLAQRIVLGYYRNKLRTIALLSPRKAAEEAFKIFCTPYSRRKAYKAPPIFEKAEKHNFILNDETIHGFIWRPETKNGHKILICHGFDSRSYKFDRYIKPLLRLGFEVLAFDAPAHGLSTGKTINANQYSNVIIEINNRFGPIDGIMAHSLGGLAVALAMEKMPNNQQKRLVLIAPATETSTAIRTFFSYFPLNTKVKEEFEKLIVELGGQASEWYSVSRIVKKLTTPTLWVHDEEDKVTPFEDMKHMIDLNLDHVQFEITKGLGHSMIYKDNKITKRIVGFLSSLLPEENSQEKRIAQ